jgi:hypothetical protein
VSLLRREPAVTAMLGVRLAVLAGAAASLLWSPVRGSAVPPFAAYGGLSDLVFGGLAHWDAVWFVHIADHGYDSEQATAFFPVYPLVVAAVAGVARSTIVAGVVVSLVAAAVAAAVVVRIARDVLPARVAHDAVLYLALYPLAFVFTAVYSDALYLALAAAAFLAAQRQRAWLAGLLGALAVDTRLIGLALLPALLVLLWPRQSPLRARSAPLSLLLLPAALAAYMVYLQARFGDALAFARAQATFWHRHVSAAGPFGGLWDATAAAWRGTIELIRHLPPRQGYPGGFARHDVWASWNVLQFALLLAALWLTWVAWRRLGPAFGLYSAATIAIVLSSPDDLVPLVSFPRFLLADFPLFLALAALTERRARAREAVLVCFGAVGAVAAVAFAHDVWVA